MESAEVQTFVTATHVRVYFVIRRENVWLVIGLLPTCNAAFTLFCPLSVNTAFLHVAYLRLEIGNTFSHEFPASLGSGPEQEIQAPMVKLRLQSLRHPASA